MKKISKNLHEEMKETIVNCPKKRISLYDLCEKIGIQKRVKYFNDVEKLRPKGQRECGRILRVVKQILGYGLIFKNGIEIKHVETAVFHLYPDIEVIEKKERSNKVC